MVDYQVLEVIMHNNKIFMLEIKLNKILIIPVKTHFNQLITITLLQINYQEE